jgi:ketosteroid isomerase-like protein
VDEGSDAALARLLDLDAIRDLPRRYARCVWERDAEGAAQLFAPDGVMDTGDGAPLLGCDAIRETYRRAFAEQTLLPFVHNHVVELEGDRARGRCDLDLRGTVDGRAMIGAGTYEDRYVRTADGWRFGFRRLVLRFFVPLGEGWGARPI